MVVSGPAKIVSQHQIKLKDESEINQGPENNTDAGNAIQAGNITGHCVASLEPIGQINHNNR
jgi:ABC-type nitrate/sulfonate/bicarbonate transport system substrate-binding protein